MARARIDAGICGFETVVETKKQGRKCLVNIQSDCEAIQELAEVLTEVDPFEEIMFKGEGPLTFRMAANHCKHTACPVPVGIIKAIEIASGLALPKNAVIELSKTDD